jgi:hypothetical protein
LFYSRDKCHDGSASSLCLSRGDQRHNRTRTACRGHGKPYLRSYVGALFLRLERFAFTPWCRAEHDHDRHDASAQKRERACISSSDRAMVTSRPASIHAHQVSLSFDLPSHSISIPKRPPSTVKAIISLCTSMRPSTLKLDSMYFYAAMDAKTSPTNPKIPPVPKTSIYVEEPESPASPEPPRKCSTSTEVDYHTTVRLLANRFFDLGLIVLAQLSKVYADRCLRLFEEEQQRSKGWRKDWRLGH